MVHHIHKLSPVTKVVLGGMMALGECVMSLCELAFENGRNAPEPVNGYEVQMEQDICFGEECPL